MYTNQSERVDLRPGWEHKGQQQRSSNHHRRGNYQPTDSYRILSRLDLRGDYICFPPLLTVLRKREQRGTRGLQSAKCMEQGKVCRTERNNKRLNSTATSGGSSTSCPRGNRKQWLNATSKIRYSMRRAVRLIGA